MYLDKTVISIIFRIINFSLIIALFVYLFRTYVVTMIKEAIQRDDALEQERHRKKKSLEHEVKLLDKQMQEQAHLCDHLMKKVKQWDEIFKENEHSKAKEQKTIQEEIQKKMNVQVEQIEKRRVYKQVVPQALDKARNELEAKYKEKENGEHFLNYLMRFMEQNIS